MALPVYWLALSSLEETSEPWLSIYTRTSMRGEAKARYRSYIISTVEICIRSRVFVSVLANVEYNPAGDNTNQNPWYPRRSGVINKTRIM